MQLYSKALLQPVHLSNRHRRLSDSGLRGLLLRLLGQDQEARALAKASHEEERAAETDNVNGTIL